MYSGSHNATLKECYKQCYTSSFSVHTHTHMYYTCYTCNYIIIVNDRIKVFPSATCTKWLLTNKLHVCMMTKSYSRLEFRNRPSILYVI